MRRTNNTSTTSNALAVYRRSAAAGEPASYTWGIAGGAFAVGGIQSFSGADAASPIDVESGQSTASATAHDTPSITTSVANTMLVTAHTYASSNSWTPQVGLTEGFDRPSGANSTTGQSVTGGYQLKAATGASGAKRSTAGGGADVGNTHILALRPFVPNTPPTVSLTSPANGSTFTAPASITLTATAADSDGTIQKVEFFHGGTNLIATVNTAPYTFPWTGVPQGSYVLTAVATDNQTATTTSAPVNVTVQAVVALYFVEVDHLNTPRLVANSSGTPVWRWDQQEPFGVNVPDENPSGLGVFEQPLRFPGQYADKETNLNYNYFRDYDPGIGRYPQSDPIGLKGGPNTYAYVDSSPLLGVDPRGLVKWKGTVFYRGTGPIGGDIYQLMSECKCGIQYSVEVRTLNTGTSRGFSWVGQHIEFDDLMDCPDPEMLAGDYLNIGLSVSAGLGGGFGTTLLGAAQSPGSWGWQMGFSASAGLSVGRSWLEIKTAIPCGPCSTRK